MIAVSPFARETLIGHRESGNSEVRRQLLQIKPVQQRIPTGLADRRVKPEIGIQHRGRVVLPKGSLKSQPFRLHLCHLIVGAAHGGPARDKPLRDVKCIKMFTNFVPSHRSDVSPTVWDEVNQAFGRQANQRLPHRRSRNAELADQRCLVEVFPRHPGIGDDFLLQRLIGEFAAFAL